MLPIEYSRAIETTFLTLWENLHLKTRPEKRFYPKINVDREISSGVPTSAAIDMARKTGLMLVAFAAMLLSLADEINNDDQTAYLRARTPEGPRRNQSG